jgi:hypothetical protein
MSSEDDFRLRIGKGLGARSSGIFFRNNLFCLDVLHLRRETSFASKLTAFWDIAPCSLFEVEWRFRGAFCLHNQGEDAYFNETTWRYILESSQGRGVHVTGVSAAYTFKLNKNILSE